MPNRILKDSICTSDTIDQLSAKDEVFFYRLIVNCDDFGRMDARLPILKAKLFPLKLEVSVDDIKNALVRLAAAGCVGLYRADGKPYVYLTTWEKHQNIRAKKSKYPAPEEGEKIDACDCENLYADEIICKQKKSSECKSEQMQANVPVIQSNPIQSKSESKSESKRARTREDFDLFWNAYPKKKSKADAEKAFKKLNPDKQLLDTMLDALEEQKRSQDWKRDNGQFIPYPATWLNGRRWEDDAGGGYSMPDYSATIPGVEIIDASY